MKNISSTIHELEPPSQALLGWNDYNQTVSDKILEKINNQWTYCPYSQGPDWNSHDLLRKKVNDLETQTDITINKALEQTYNFRGRFYDIVDDKTKLLEKYLTRIYKVIIGAKVAEYAWQVEFLRMIYLNLFSTGYRHFELPREQLE